MTIDEIKELVTEAIQSKLTEAVKAQGMIAFQSFITDTGKPLADEFVAKVKEQAAAESGWCAFRDKYFIPGLVQVGVYAITKVLSQIVDASPIQVTADTATKVDATVEPAADEKVTVTPAADTQEAATPTADAQESAKEEATADAATETQVVR